MNADAPRKRILPSFPDLVKELSQTSFAAKEDIERVAREVVTEELNRIKQGSSPRGMDALVGKAQRLLDPPPPPSGASILDDGDPFLETTGSHDLRGIWDRKTPLIGEESGTEILPAVSALEAPATEAAPSVFGQAPPDADDSSVFGPLPDVEAQRTSVLPPPQTPLPPPYAGGGSVQPAQPVQPSGPRNASGGLPEFVQPSGPRDASGALPDFELDLSAVAEAPGELERTLEEPLPVAAPAAEPELQLGRLPEFAAQGPGDDTLSRLDFEAGNVDMKAAVRRYYTPPPFRTPGEGLRAAVAPPESFDEVPPAAGESPDLAATTAYEPAVPGLPPFSAGDSSVFGAPLAPLPPDDDGVFGASVSQPSEPYAAGAFDAGVEPELPPSPYGSSVQPSSAPLFSSLDPVAGAVDLGAPGDGPRAPEPRIAWASEEPETPEERPRASRPDGTTRLSGEVRHDETLVFAASQPTRRSPLFFAVVAAALIGGAYVAIRYVKPRMVAEPAAKEPAAETPVPAVGEPTPSTSQPPEATVPAAVPPPTAVPTAVPPAPTATAMPTPKAATPTPSAPAVAPPQSAQSAQSAPVPVPVSTRPLQPAPAGKARAQTMVSRDWAGKEPVFVIHFVSGKDRKIVEKEAVAIGKRVGLSASTIEVDLGEKGIWFRAVVGEFATVDEALAKHAELKAAETKGMGLVYRLAGP